MVRVQATCWVIGVFVYMVLFVNNLTDVLSVTLPVII